MAGLYFTVGADFDKLQKLRRDIDSLKTQLRGMDKATDPRGVEKLEKRLAQLTQEFDREALAAQRAGAMTARAGKEASGAADDFGGLQSMLLKFGGTAFFGKMLKDVVDVRSEFQNTEAMFKVFLGSAEKAKAFVSDIQKYAFNNVFEFKDLTQQSAQLLAFQHRFEDIIPIIDKLSNVAAGSNKPLSELVDLYNKAKSQGKLMTDDIQQWQRAGVPVITELSKAFNVTEQAMWQMVTTGRVGFKEIDDVINKLTSSGGMFAGMMEEKMKTLGDSVGLLQDTITSTLNEIGEASEDILRTGILTANTLVENYKEIAEILGVLIGLYGTYRAAMALEVAFNRSVQAIKYTQETIALEALLTSEQKAVISKMNLTRGTAEYNAAVKSEIMAHSESLKAKYAEAQADLQSLYAKRAAAKEALTLAQAKTAAARQELASAIATAQAEAAAKQQKELAILKETAALARRDAILLQSQKIAAQQAVIDAKAVGTSAAKVATLEAEIVAVNKKLVVAKAEALQAQQNVAAKQAEIAAGVQSVSTKKIETLTNRVNTLSEKENAAAASNNALVKQTVAGKILIKKIATDAETASTRINTATNVANTATTNILATAKLKLANILTKVDKILMANKFSIAVVGAVALTYAVYKLITYETDAEKAQRRLNEAVADFRKETAAEQVEIDRLFDKLKNTSKESANYQKVKDEIISKYGSYLEGLRTEIRTLNDVEAAYRAISVAAKQSAIDRAIAGATKDAQETYAENVKEYNQNLLKELKTKMSSGAAEAFLETINLELEKTGELSDQTKEKLKQFNYEVTHLETGDVISKGNSAEFWLNKMGNNKALLDKTYKSIQQQFGISINEYEGLAKDQVETYIESFDKAITNFNNTGNKQAIELGGKWITFESEEELNLHLKKLKDVRDNYDKVGEVSQIKNKAHWEKIKKEAEGARDALDESEKGGKQWLELTETIKNAEGKLKLWESPTKAGSAGESAAEKARKQSEEYKKAKEKQSLEETRAIRDLEIQLAEAEIKYMEEGSAKVLAQLDLNHEKEKQALERQQQDALKTKKDNARALFEADAANKGKTFDDSSIKLTEEELKKYQDLQKKNEEIYQKDRLTLEMQYMRDYIQEYGTFQQKKLAIAQEYDKKIAASQNEWEKKSLENQKRAAISNVDFDAINKQIDWQGVFGNMTGMLESQLKETLRGLKDYIKTEQFKASSDTDKKTVYDAIEKLRSVTPGGEGTLYFNVIRQQMDDLGTAINDLQTATINQKAALDNQSKAQKKYEEAIKSGDQALVESAKQSRDMADTVANAAVTAYKNAESNVEGLGNAFKETATETVDGLNLVADGLGNFASNSLPQIFKGLQNTVTGLSKLDIGGKVGDAIGSLSKALGKTDITGQLIGAILSILDVLKDGIGTLVANLIDTVLNAVDGILKDVLSGGIVTKIANSLKDGISNILNTVSFGGFGSLISSINGGNAKETAETISRLTTSNEALKVSVDALKEEISGSNGAKSIEAYNEAVEAQKRYNENLRNILNAQMKYSSSHHSNSYYWNLNSNSLKEVNKLLGTSLKNTWGDFSKLTADQMNEIRTHLPDIWSEMINQGKYGDRFKDDWNNYADQAGKLSEMTEELRENIAQISFSSLRDSFVDALMDMNSDAEDFAGNFEEYLTKALLNFAIGDLLDDDLKKWYESWTDSMNSQAGKLTEEQIEQYKKQWDEMVQEGLNTRDEIASLTGYTGKDSSSSQQASKGVYQGMSQDTGDRLEARNTAIHMTTERMDNKLLTISTDIRNMTDQMVRVGELTEQSLHHMEEIKTIQLNSYYELKDINNNTKQLYQMNDRLGEMNDKLSRL